MDLTTLTTAVDFSSMLTAALAVGGVILAYVVAIKGVQLVIGMVRRA